MKLEWNVVDYKRELPIDAIIPPPLGLVLHDEKPKVVEQGVGFVEALGLMAFLSVGSQSEEATNRRFTIFPVLKR